MDNECSSIIKDYLIYEKNVELILVLPYLYRTNMTKKAIDIFKLHFIADLAIVDPKFPLYL